MITATSYLRDRDDSYINVYAGSDWGKGAYISLMGYNHSIDGGTVALNACSTSGAYKTLWLKPDGTATWDGKNLAMQEDVIPRSGGAVMTGDTIGRVNNNSYLNLCGGANWSDGATVNVVGKSSATYTGTIQLHPNNGTQEKTMWLKPDGTWTWNGSAVQLVSDQRYKQQITEIDDKLLDAWEDVNLVQFKYNDAVDQKGDNARLHTGYVVQQIDSACKSHGVDVSVYGLYCHEEYQEKTEEVTIENEDGTIKKETKVIEPAKEYYSLRYTETLVVECAYLRRENTKLKQLLQNHEERLKALEK